MLFGIAMALHNLPGRAFLRAILQLIRLLAPTLPAAHDLPPFLSCYRSHNQGEFS
jgi:hypothetical protein